MQSSACPVCGSTKIGRTHRAHDHEYAIPFVAEYAECPGCGSLHQWPMPSPAELGSFYPAAYHSFALKSKLMEYRYSMRIARLRRFLDRPGAILDYGCGGGGFLLQAAAEFPDRLFFGYEIADTNSVEILADGRVTIFKGSPDVIWSQLPPCQVVILNHVIEHLPAPRDTLANLFAALAPGGHIDGQTPRADSYDRRVFGQYWSGFHAPRHTVIFSQRGLRLALEGVGFRQVSIGAAFNPAGIAMSLGAIRHGANPGCVERTGIWFLCLMSIATALAPLDFISGSPGIVNFAGKKEVEK